MTFTIEILRQEKRKRFIVLRSEDYPSLKLNFIYNPETDNTNKFWLFVLLWDGVERYKLTTFMGMNGPETVTEINGSVPDMPYIYEVIDQLKKIATKRRQRWLGRRDDNISWDRILNAQLELQALAKDT